MGLLLAVLVAAAVVFAAWRMYLMGSGGCRVVVRRMPADGDHGWRHGTVRFGGEGLSYYKLRSVLPMADKIISRHDITIQSRRDLSESEKTFIAPNMRVLLLSAGQDTYEAAMDTCTETALTSWLESAPNPLLERVNELGAFRTKIRRRP